MRCALTTTSVDVVMAAADIPARVYSSKKTLTLSERVKELLDILFTAQDGQACRIAGRIADRHSIFWTQIHAWHVDYVKRLLGMFLVVALDRLLQLRQWAQRPVTLQFLLALSAGQYELPLPRRRICLLVAFHSQRLDAGFPW